MVLQQQETERLAREVGDLLVAVDEVASADFTVRAFFCVEDELVTRMDGLRAALRLTFGGGNERHTA